MKIGLIGGTGDLGEGLALRLADRYEIYIGSRYKEKADRARVEYLNKLKDFKQDVKIYSDTNENVAMVSDIVVLCIPYKYTMKTIETLKDYLEKKIIISPIVPMEYSNDMFRYKLFNGRSLAETLQDTLHNSYVVAALHSISAEKLRDIRNKVTGDVLICGNHDFAKKKVSEIIENIKELKVYDIGDISMSIALESITVALLNITKKHGIKNPHIKILY